MSLLEARDVTRHYRSGGGLFGKARTVKAVDGVSFALEAGTTLAVVGESGSGKSTLARIACLLEPPTTGTLLIDGAPALDTDRAERLRLRRSVQMVFQNPYGSLNPRRTIGGILAEPLAIHGVGGHGAAGRRARAEAARAMLERVGLSADHAGRYPHMFSGGQRQRVAIARALMLRPRIVIADEPVSALDLSIQAQILNLLMDLQDEFGLAYLFISHDLAVVRHIAASVMVMYLGRIVEQGAAASIFARPPPSLYAHAARRHALGGAGARRAAAAAVGEPPSADGSACRLRLPWPLRLCNAALRRDSAGTPPGRRRGGRLPPCRGNRNIMRQERGLFPTPVPALQNCRCDALVFQIAIPISLRQRRHAARAMHSAAGEPAMESVLTYGIADVRAGNGSRYRGKHPAARDPFRAQGVKPSA